MSQSKMALPTDNDYTVTYPYNPLDDDSSGAEYYSSGAEFDASKAEFDSDEEENDVQCYTLDSSDGSFPYELPPSYHEATQQSAPVIHHYGPYDPSTNYTPAYQLGEKSIHWPTPPSCPPDYQSVSTTTENPKSSKENVMKSNSPKNSPITIRLDDDDDDDEEYWAQKEGRPYQPNNKQNNLKPVSNPRPTVSVRTTSTKGYQHPQYRRWLAQQVENRTRIMSQLNWCWTTAEYPCFDCDFILGIDQRKGSGVGILMADIYFCEDCYYDRHLKEGTPINFKKDITYLDREDHLAQELIYQKKVQGVRKMVTQPGNRASKSPVVPPGFHPLSHPMSTDSFSITSKPAIPMPTGPANQLTGGASGWYLTTESSSEDSSSDDGELIKAINMSNRSQHLPTSIPTVAQQGTVYTDLFSDLD